LEKEIKLVKYVLLTYIMYGLMNVFIIKNFVVPLPIIYFAIPIVALYFFVKSYRSLLALNFLLIPFVIIKDILVEFHPNLVFTITLISLLSWVFIGFYVLIHSKPKNKVSYFFGGVLILSFLVLLPSEINLSNFLLPLIGLASLLFIISTDTSIETSQEKIIVRFALLFVLISGLFVSTLLSIFLIS
jgi:hypothetical protein